MAHATNRCASRHRLFGVVLVVALAYTSASHAASFTVTSLLDAADATLGDGVCATASGSCTLRAAIQEANTLAGPDSIILPAGIIRLHEGDLQITDDLSISGAGATGTMISGARGARVVTIAGSANVTISDMQIQRGSLNWGGGLRNDGMAILSNVTFARNHAPGGAASGYGGAVYNDGILQLANVTFTRNATSGTAGSFGGGLFNDGSAILTNVTFTGNRASGCGGGLYNRGDVTLTNAVLTNNRAGNSGGGLFNELGSIALAAVTISANRAAQIGGGLFNYDTVTLRNTTINGNRAFDSGAIFNRYGTMALTNATISGNRTSYGGAVRNQHLFDESTVTFKNTIVATNQPQNCTSDPVTSLGHNLDSGMTCNFAAPGDLSNVDPALHALHDNGGFAPTQALLPGSPAIDAGDDADCPTTDQCGARRPMDGNGDGVAVCDIGAYEMQP